ncbi:hypothetical protein N7475_008753 [Neofusicoccum parvum]|uniref:Uncharacterized protein n=1 Tax=Neofusicoccum parvum TaxID=310453 RepID=A0ACB5SN76_9PEZI|nr:hypothetical protein N7475_008753 [Neofusicoccum parvum]
MFSNVFLAGFDGTVTVTTYATIGSEFNTVNLASWITISYLLTSTAMQPLYGRFSDIFGRKPCFLGASVTFGLGCLGCGLSRNILCLNLMRALAGVGGGGLMTMATIINSDIVSPHKRGMYQAVQNLLLGLGAICGASFGGLICDWVGWRWCFLLQTPVSILAILAGQFALRSRQKADTGAAPQKTKRLVHELDLAGACLLVLCLLAQVGSLSLGGNVLNWSDPLVVFLLVSSIILFGVFVFVEKNTTAVPILALKMLREPSSVLLLISNLLLGVVVYGLLFTMPLFFQAVLLDSPFKAGLRMILPSMATPLGSLVAGMAMSRNASLPLMTQVGMLLLSIGSGLLLLLRMDRGRLGSVVLLVLPNLGAGIAFPSSLFQFINMFDKPDHAVATSTIYATRSIGSVWGVAVVSAVIQDGLARILPIVLRDQPDANKLVEKIRHSMKVAVRLPPSIQLAVQDAFCEAIHRAIAVLAVCAIVGFLGSWVSVRMNRQRD